MINDETEQLVGEDPQPQQHYDAREAYMRYQEAQDLEVGVFACSLESNASWCHLYPTRANTFVSHCCFQSQFIRPSYSTPDEMRWLAAAAATLEDECSFFNPSLVSLRRERYVKYGVALVGLTTIVTVLDAIANMF